MRSRPVTGRELKRLEVKIGRRMSIIALDVENDPKTGKFISAAVFGKINNTANHHRRDEKTVDYYTENQADFIDFISKIPKRSCLIVTYNLSYDRVFFDSIIDHNTLIEIGQRVICFRLKPNNIQVMDLFNHTMIGSLGEWVKWLNMPEKYGVYKLELSQLKDRNKMDAKATYYLGEFLQDFYINECNVPMRLTVASTALRLFQQHYLKSDWYRSDKVADIINPVEREAYFGGRCELFQRGEQPTYSYDVNSMYLSIMRDCLIPDPSTAYHYNGCPDNWQGLFKKYLGIWEVTITIPDMPIPPLPVRLDGKLKFPVGTVRGTWCSVELQAAIDQGCKISVIHSCIVYKKAGYYFRGFAEFVWKKRLKYKEKKSVDKGLDNMIKRLGNSLYGKFGERHNNGYFGRLADYPGNVPDGARILEYNNEDYLFISDSVMTPSRHEFPCISAFITAYARIKLYKAMIANIDKIIYCDTDSLKTTAPAVGIVIGNGLGDWGLEYENKAIIYYRPKLYGDKHKGVPKTAKKVECGTHGEKWVYEKPLRYREAIKKNDTPNRWVTVEKILNYQDDKRIWIDTKSKAICIDTS